MKRSFWLVLLTLAAPAVFGLGYETKMQPAPGPVAMPADIAAARTALVTQGIITSNPCDYYDFELLYVIVINAPGKNGTFYRTDYVVINPLTDDEEVLISVLPAGVSGAGMSAHRYTLRASTIYSIVDFLGSESGDLNISGVASLFLTTVFPGTNTINTNGRAYGGSIMYTNLPGSSGTTSFYSGAVSPTSIQGSGAALAAGLRQNMDFRSNFGIVNLDTGASHSWTVNVLGGGSTGQASVTVPPWSMQYAAVPNVVPSSTGYLALDFVPSISLKSQWSGFITTADNTTGDARLALGLQFRF